MSILGFMEEIVHERLPRLAEFDGSTWMYSAVCGRLVETVQLARPGRRPSCPECLADLGLADQLVLPHTSLTVIPAGWIRQYARGEE